MAMSVGEEEILDSAVNASSSNADGAAVASSSTPNRKPTCVIVLGMAGSGKTTFVQVA